MKTEQHLSEKTTTALNKSVETMSTDTQDKLQSVRREALALHLENVKTSPTVQHSSHEERPSIFRSLFTLSVMSTGLAFSVLAFLAINLNQDDLNQNNSQVVASNSELSEFILSDNFDETELEVVEDIEFAYWLSQELKHKNIDDALFDRTRFDNRQQHNG